jgi:hypothetical protein
LRNTDNRRSGSNNLPDFCVNPGDNAIDISNQRRVSRLITLIFKAGNCLLETGLRCFIATSLLSRIAAATKFFAQFLIAF